MQTSSLALTRVLNTVGTLQYSASYAGRIVKLREAFG